jgi:hypothetical protein
MMNSQFTNCTDIIVMHSVFKGAFHTLKLNRNGQNFPHNWELVRPSSMPDPKAAWTDLAVFKTRGLCSFFCFNLPCDDFERFQLAKTALDHLQANLRRASLTFTNLPSAQRLLEACF